MLAGTAGVLVLTVADGMGHVTQFSPYGGLKTEDENSRRPTPSGGWFTPIRLPGRSEAIARPGP